jgi:hypothetical protein
MNYFNYFTEIEDAFVRRRGKHLYVGSTDWALIEVWKQIGVPLHVALRGIEKAFDSWEAKPRKRTVKSLLYCQEEVEAQYAEWLEARVGATVDSEEDDAQADSSGGDKELPFARKEILDHLGRARSEILNTAAKREGQHEDDLSIALERAAPILAELEEDFASTAQPDAQKLEVSLTGLESMLSQAILSSIASVQLDTVSSQVKEQLRMYKSHMEPAVYKQTFDNLLLKRLREQLGVPRLSLFYL